MLRSYKNILLNGYFSAQSYSADIHCFSFFLNFALNLASPALHYTALQPSWMTPHHAGESACGQSVVVSIVIFSDLQANLYICKFTLYKTAIIFSLKMYCFSIKIIF